MGTVDLLVTSQASESSQEVLWEGNSQSLTPLGDTVMLSFFIHSLHLGTALFHHVLTTHDGLS